MCVWGARLCAADFLFSVRSQPGPAHSLLFLYQKDGSYLLNKPEEFAATWGNHRNVVFRSIRGREECVDMVFILWSLPCQVITGWLCPSPKATAAARRPLPTLSLDSENCFPPLTPSCLGVVVCPEPLLFLNTAYAFVHCSFVTLSPHSIIWIGHLFVAISCSCWFIHLCICLAPSSVSVMLEE